MKHIFIRAVLFDAGNTLMHLDYDFVAEVLVQHGHRIPATAIRIAEYRAKEAVDRYFTRDRAPTGTAERFLWPDSDGSRPSYFGVILDQLGLRDAPAAPILAALEEYNRDSCLWRVIQADTPDVLQALGARGFVLGVISNADGRVEADLEDKGLRSHFATVIDSSVVGVEKPDPAIFRLALEQLGTTAERAVYVGDVFAVDVLGARRAGLQAILLDTLGRYPGTPDCPRIRSLAELLDLLPERASP